MSAKEKDLLSLGWVGRPHGLQGEVQLSLHNPQSRSLTPGQTLFLQLPAHNTPQPYTIEEVRLAPNKAIVALYECTDRTQAEALRRAEVFLEIDRLDPLEEGEYYFFQLEGLPLFSPDGEPLGVVQQVLDGPASDLLCVRYEQRDVLVPIVEAFVREIDLEKGRIIVDPIPGLFDDDTA